jgi:hypothetical protein
VGPVGPGQDRLEVPPPRRGPRREPARSGAAAGGPSRAWSARSAGGRRARPPYRLR